MYKYFFKRFFDFCIALVALICLSPLLLVVTVWLYIADKGGDVFFRQKRAGKKGKLFDVIKFKSMSDKKDDSGKLLPDTERITKVGKFVRSTSIDELPQLWNVLKGDMSLIGPRPLLPEYVPLYDKIQIRRLNVRPGITGWAQVHGRNGLKLSKRFEYDVYYSDHISFLFDMKIFFMTFKSLLPSAVVVDRNDLTGVDDLGFDIKAFNENHK